MRCMRARELSHDVANGDKVERVNRRREQPTRDPRIRERFSENPARALTLRAA